MLLLDYQNVLIEALLRERFTPGLAPHHRHAQRHLLTTPLSAIPVSIDQVVSDFDGVTFHIHTPETKSKIVISTSIRCFSELVQYGAEQVLQEQYGPYILPPETGYDFTIGIDLDGLPTEQGLSASESYRLHGRVES